MASGVNPELFGILNSQISSPILSLNAIMFAA